MRIVVQDPQTGHYLQETGGWTTDVREALDFASSAAAMTARQRHQVADASLVFRFEREGYAITVPLEPLPPEGPTRPVPHKSAREEGLLIG